jgi:hypothetical protein
MRRMERQERTIRQKFELWAQGGTKRYFYRLGQAANGEYISPFTEFAWRAYRDGFEAVIARRASQETKWAHD